MSKSNYNGRPISDWLVTDSGVFILFGNGYQISYNPSTRYTFNYKKMHDPLFNYDEDVDCEETALYIHDRDCYLILDGDFRDEYESCSTLRQCLVVYKKNAPYFRSRWSMDNKAAI